MYDLKNTKMIIYKITNKVNGKCYIGQTTRTFEQRYDTKGEGVERVYNYHKNLKDKGRHHNEHFLRAIEKYGFDSFTVEILEVCKTKNKLNNREKFYIDKYKSSNPNYGYNKTKGGEGVVHTREVKMKKANTRRANILNRTTTLFEEFGKEEVEIELNKKKFSNLKLYSRKILLVMLCFQSVGKNEIDLKELKYVSKIENSYKRLIEILKKLKEQGVVDFTIEEETIVFKIMNDVQLNSDYNIHIKTKHLNEMKIYIEAYSKYYSIGRKVHIKKCLVCEKTILCETNNKKYCEHCAKKVKYSQRESSRKSHKMATA